MGYYITLTNADFAIPETDEVLQVLKDANWKFHDWKNGGMFSGEGTQARWFSWMPENYDELVTSVADVFTMLGFQVDSYEGKVHLTFYDHKTGQQDLFIAIVSPFVEEGSSLEWRGEDGAMWRHEVANGKLMVAEGFVKYDSYKPYVLLDYEYDSATQKGNWIECHPYSEIPPSEQYAQQTSVSA